MLRDADDGDGFGSRAIGAAPPVVRPSGGRRRSGRRLHQGDSHSFNVAGRRRNGGGVGARGGGRGCIQIAVVVQWRQVICDDVFVTVFSAALFTRRVNFYIYTTNKTIIIKKASAISVRHKQTGRLSVYTYIPDTVPNEKFSLNKNKTLQSATTVNQSSLAETARDIRLGSFLFRNSVQHSFTTQRRNLLFSDANNNSSTTGNTHTHTRTQEPRCHCRNAAAAAGVSPMRTKQQPPSH